MAATSRREEHHIETMRYVGVRVDGRESLHRLPARGAIRPFRRYTEQTVRSQRANDARIRCDSMDVEEACASPRRTVQVFTFFGCEFSLSRLCKCSGVQVVLFISVFWFVLVFKLFWVVCIKLRAHLATGHCEYIIERTALQEERDPKCKIASRSGLGAVDGCTDPCGDS